MRTLLTLSVAAAAFSASWPMRPTLSRPRLPGRPRPCGGGRTLQGPGHQWRWPHQPGRGPGGTGPGGPFRPDRRQQGRAGHPKEFRAYHRTLKDAKASGGGATPAPAGAFAKLDKNGDGQLSRDEVAGHPRLAADFDTLDTNHDGQLSPAELAALRKKP
jgi:hypothetical protein